MVGWGAFAAVSNGAKSDGDAQANSGACASLADPRCVDLTDTVNRQNTFHTLSLASLVGGLVCLAAGGGVMAWAATSKNEASVPTVTPSISPSSLGFTLRGAF